MHIICDGLPKPLSKALLKPGLPGKLPGIFRDSSGTTTFQRLGVVEICAGTPARNFAFPTPCARVREPPLAHHSRYQNSQQKGLRTRIPPDMTRQPCQAMRWLPEVALLGIFRKSSGILPGFPATFFGIHTRPQAPYRTGASHTRPQAPYHTGASHTTPQAPYHMGPGVLYGRLLFGFRPSGISSGNLPETFRNPAFV